MHFTCAFLIVSLSAQNIVVCKNVPSITDDSIRIGHTSRSYGKSATNLTSANKNRTKSAASGPLGNGGVTNDNVMFLQNKISDDPADGDTDSTDKTAAKDVHKKVAVKHEKSTKQKRLFIIIIGVGCVTVLILLIVFVICCVTKNACGMNRKNEEIFYDASQFQHMGPLQICNKEDIKLETSRDASNEVEAVAQGKRFTFTTSQNEVYDIGSEVEKIVN